jgi:hypothetical protein
MKPSGIALYPLLAGDHRRNHRSTPRASGNRVPYPSGDRFALLGDVLKSPFRCWGQASPAFESGPHSPLCGLPSSSCSSGPQRIGPVDHDGRKSTKGLAFSLEVPMS